MTLAPEWKRKVAKITVAQRRQQCSGTMNGLQPPVEQCRQEQLAQNGQPNIAVCARVKLVFASQSSDTPALAGLDQVMTIDDCQPATAPS
jgi:hypothetical protein